MPEMRIRIPAPHFDTLCEEAVVLLLNDVARFEGPGEAGPSGSGIVLVKRSEEGFTRNDIHVNPFSLVIVVFVLEGRLGALFLRNLVLHLRQSLPQGCIVR